MTYTYSANVQSGFTINTDSIAVEITAPSNTTLKIKKIRITQDDGTATTSSDYCRKIKIVTESSAGSGGSSYTPITTDQNEPVSVATVNINSGSFTVGAIDATIDKLSLHSATDFIWQAGDDDDKITVKPGGIFAVVINPAN